MSCCQCYGCYCTVYLMADNSPPANDLRQSMATFSADLKLSILDTGRPSPLLDTWGDSPDCCGFTSRRADDDAFNPLFNITPAWRGVGCHDTCVIPGSDSSNLSNWRRGYPTHLNLGSEYVPRILRSDNWSNQEGFGIHARNIPASLGDVSTLKTINLANNAFRGQIPESIFSMPHLSDLELSFNRLSGTLPANLSWRGNLREQLQYLGLAQNSIGGTLPDLSPLTNLTGLFLRDNDFVGNVASELLSSHTNLVGLSLGGNQNLTIRGGLSDVFKHTKLVQLDLRNTQLNGSIPESIGDLKDLRQLDLSRNKLTGSLPTSVSNATSLEVLFLNDNMLSGSVPKLRAMVNLEKINLGNNNFDGTLAKDTFSQMASLFDVKLFGNAFTGTMPDIGAPGANVTLNGVDATDNQFSSIGTIAPGTHIFSFNVSRNKLTDLSGACHDGVVIEGMDVSFNPLTGVIPPCLCDSDAAGLRIFHATNATLRGELPACLLTKLQTLDLSSNMLTGLLPEIAPPIPTPDEPAVEIFRPPMTILALDHNNFSGSIPSSWAQLSNLQVLGVSHNKLQGALPSFHTLPSLRTLSVEYNALNETAWTAWASYARNAIGSVFELTDFVAFHGVASQTLELIDVTDDKLLRQFYVPGTPLLDIFNSTEANVAEIPSPWRQLEILKLSGNDFANARVTAWDVVLLITLWCPRLTRLRLDDLTFDVLDAFAANAEFGTDLTRTQTDWPSDFFPLFTHPLEELTMRKTPAQLPQSGNLADSFRSLHTLLMVSDAQQLPSPVPQHILGLASLRALDLSDTSHSGLNITTADDWPSLQTLTLPRLGVASSPFSAGQGRAATDANAGNFTIAFSVGRNLSLPSLRVLNGSLIIADNSTGIVTLPNLETVDGDLIAEGVLELEGLFLPELRNVTGAIVVERNPSLVFLSAPQLSEASTIDVRNNPLLDQVTLNDMDTLERINIRSNNNLSSVSFVSFQDERGDMCAAFGAGDFSDNSRLESISAGWIDDCASEECPTGYRPAYTSAGLTCVSEFISTAVVFTCVLGGTILVTLATILTNYYFVRAANKAISNRRNRLSALAPGMSFPAYAGTVLVGVADIASDVLFIVIVETSSSDCGGSSWPWATAAAILAFTSLLNISCAVTTLIWLDDKKNENRFKGLEDHEKQYNGKGWKALPATLWLIARRLTLCASVATLDAINMLPWNQPKRNTENDDNEHNENDARASDKAAAFGNFWFPDYQTSPAEEGYPLPAPAGGHNPGAHEGRSPWKVPRLPTGTLAICSLSIAFLEDFGQFGVQVAFLSRCRPTFDAWLVTSQSIMLSVLRASLCVAKVCSFIPFSNAQTPEA